MVVGGKLVSALIGLALCVPVSPVSAHPIHMSYTEVRHSPATNVVEISVRVYANDFAAAAARRARISLRGDSAIDTRTALAYLQEKFGVVDGSKRPLTLVSCGVSRSQDMLRFCFRANAPAGMSALHVRNAILTELFSDQVNVVQSVSSRGRSSRLFVRGDTWKSLK